MGPLFGLERTQEIQMTKPPLTGRVFIVLLAATLPIIAQAADRAARVEERYDRRGDRIEERLDTRGDRVDHRLDRRADRAAAAGFEQRAGRLDRKGDRIDARLDHKGERIDNRLDRRGTRKADRIERRLP